MGGIPEAQRIRLSQTAKGQTIQDRSGAIIADAIERAGAQVEQGFKNRAELQEKKNTLAASNIAMDYKRDYYAKRRDILNNNLTDPEGALKQVQEMHTSLLETYKGKIGDKNVRAIFAQQGAKIYDSDYESLDSWARTREYSNMVEDYNATVSKASTELTEMTTYEGFAAAKKQLRETIDVNGEGIESKKTRDARYDKMIKTAAESHLVNRAYQDPVSLIQDIQTGKYDKDFFGKDLKAKEKWLNAAVDVATKQTSMLEDMASIAGITNAIEMNAHLQAGTIKPADFQASIEFMRANTSAPKGQVEMMENMFNAFLKDKGTVKDAPEAMDAWEKLISYMKINSDDKQSQAVNVVKMVGNAAGLYANGRMSKKTYDSIMKTVFNGVSAIDIKKYGDKSRTDLKDPTAWGAKKGFKNLYNDDIFSRLLIQADNIIDKDMDIPKSEKIALKLNVFQQLVPALSDYLRRKDINQYDLTTDQMDIIGRSLMLGSSDETTGTASFGVLLNEKRKLKGLSMDITSSGEGRIIGIRTTGEYIIEPVGKIKEGLEND